MGSEIAIAIRFAGTAFENCYTKDDATFMFATFFNEGNTKMKTVLGLMVLAMAVMVMGCGEGAPTENTSVTTTGLESDLCAKCGCCAECEDCCKGEKCDCGMQKGTPLCCTGVKPAEGVYCKSCGHTKGSEACCAEGNETCTKCNLAKGSPLCCKVKHDEEGHDHEGHDHEGHEAGSDQEKTDM